MYLFKHFTFFKKDPLGLSGIDFTVSVPSLPNMFDCVPIEFVFSVTKSGESDPLAERRVDIENGEKNITFTITEITEPGKYSITGTLFYDTKYLLFAFFISIRSSFLSFFLLFLNI